MLRMVDQKHGVAIRQRIVPFPDSISDEARASLTRATREDGVPINSIHTMPEPGDHEAWMSIKSVVDAQYAAAI